MKSWYFAYGSNLSVDQLIDLLARSATPSRVRGSFDWPIISWSSNLSKTGAPLSPTSSDRATAFWEWFIIAVRWILKNSTSTNTATMPASYGDRPAWRSAAGRRLRHQA